MTDSDREVLNFSAESADLYDKASDTVVSECRNAIDGVDRMDVRIDDFAPNRLDAMGLVKYPGGEEIIRLAERVSPYAESAGDLAE